MTPRRVSAWRQHESWVGEAKGTEVTSEQHISLGPTGLPLQHSSSRLISLDSGTDGDSAPMHNNDRLLFPADGYVAY